MFHAHVGIDFIHSKLPVRKKWLLISKAFYLSKNKNKGMKSHKKPEKAESL